MQCPEKGFGAHGQSLTQAFLHTEIFLPFQVIFKDSPGLLLKFKHFYVLENLPLTFQDSTNSVHVVMILMQNTHVQH